MPARGILGGAVPDPDKGKPHRHVRARARLMLQGMTPEQHLAAINWLLDKRPEDTLDALIAASEDT